MQLIALILIFYCFGAAELQSLICSDSNNPRVRLVGCTKNGEGRLEVQRVSNQWSSVCPDKWSSRNAGVACQELYGTRRYASSLPAKGRFGPVNNPIRIFDTTCVGSEKTILDCNHDYDRYGTRRCNEDTAVGLCCHNECDGRNLFLAPKLHYAASCDFDSYTVTVEKPPAGPDGVIRPFIIEPFNKPGGCSASTPNENGTHNSLKVPYKGNCDVSITENATFFTFKQKVLLKGYTAGSYISRYFQYLLSITCGINRNTNKTIWLDSSPPVGITDNGTEISGNLTFDMVIKVYKDADFTKELTTPVSLEVGTPIYIELSVDEDKLAGGGKAKILVEDCYAFPTPGSPIQVPVIENQRAVEMGADIIPSQNLHKVHFKMQTFKITESITFNNLYLSCAAYVCTPNDTSYQCNNQDANNQHLLNATRFAFETVDPTAPSTSTQMRLVTAAMGVKEPTLKRKPIYDYEDLPGLGKNDIVKIGQDDGMCYRIAKGNTHLYRKPKGSSDQSPAELCPHNPGNND